MTNPLTQPKVILGVLLVLLLAAIGVAVSGFKIPAQQLVVSNTNSSNTSTTMGPYPFTDKVTTADITGKQARIKTKYGDIVFALDNAAQAPLATSSFVYLAKQGYFDGLTWHRVVADFIIQGGDPTGTGSGGPGYQFADEPVTQDYTAGTVAMAKSGPNTNGSQFFIMTKDHLTGMEKIYTIFGHVTSGMDAVLKIQQGDKMDQVTIEDLKQ